MKIRETIWLWGQDAMSHHRVGSRGENIWNLPGVNQMDPAQGARFFGIRNVCRVVMNGRPLPPFGNEMEKLRECSQVVWSVLGDSGSDRAGAASDDLDALLALAGHYPSLKGGVLDDFFRPLSNESGTDKMARLSLERVREIRDRLHHAKHPLELWIVIYESALSESYRSYLELCDAVTFWTWQGKNLTRLEDDLKRVFALSPDQKHLGGCYAWDYGAGRPIDMPLLKKQCVLYADYLKKGLLQGVIVCSNCIADIGLEAAAYIRDWIAEIGDDEIPETY